jgi:predicted AAA+ superfamily ATPase
MKNISVFQGKVVSLHRILNTKVMLKDILKQLILTKQAEIPYSVIPRDEALPTQCKAIVTIPGVRRCGKSTKMQLVINDLVAQGVAKTNILWLGFDDERLYDMTKQDLDLVLEAYRELYPEISLRDVYMFFDEIQLIKDWELFVVRVYKTYCQHIYISGSNAKMLSQEIATTLRGYGVEYPTYPLSFAEYCRFKNIPNKHLLEDDLVRLRLAWDNYNTESAFPEVVLEKEKSIREKLLQGYYNAMLFRDLVERYSISQVGTLRYFIKRLMNNLTKPTSINAIYNDIRSQGLKVTKDDLYLWADYLCECFMFIRISKFTKSLVKEQRNAFKYYFIDNGMRQAVLLPQSHDNGKLLENNVLLHLCRNCGMLDKITYYQGNKECDFVIQQADHIKQLIQVTWTMDDKETREREINGILEASRATDCNNMLIITHNEEETITIEDKTIAVIPAWKWML